MNIYVMDRGFVLVGEPEPSLDQNPLWVRLTRCALVRKWGTTAGLGELAVKGPLPATALDSEPDGTQINLDYCLRVIPCDESKWSSWGVAISPSGRTSKRN